MRSSLGGNKGRLKLNNHVVPFLLGAALPTILLFILASDRVGEQLSNWNWAGNGNLLPSQEIVDHAQELEENFPGLAQLLPEVAMEDRTVIVTSVNEAWARPNSLLDLYLESFKNGEDIEHLLNHVLIVALDPAGFDCCKSVHPHCYLLEVRGMNLSSATQFNSKRYLELVWTKLKLQQRILELGYNFLFTDADMLLFRNPFRHISLYADMTASTDDFSAARAPLDNQLNTGLYYMKATNRSIEMLRYWQGARKRFPKYHDQVVFSRIKHELVSKLQVRIEPLDTLYFGGFCEYHDDFSRAVTMHADCCVGVDNKVHDLKDIAADWNKYKSLTPEEKKNSGNLTWTVPARCRTSVRWRKPQHP